MATDSSGLSSIQPSEDLSGIPDEELLSHSNYKIPEKDSARPGLSHTTSPGKITMARRMGICEWQDLGHMPISIFKQQG